MTENRLREWRVKRGLSQPELAERSGVPVSTISDVERGAEPKVRTAIRLARALTARVEQLWQA